MSESRRSHMPDWILAVVAVVLAIKAFWPARQETARSEEGVATANVAPDTWKEAAAGPLSRGPLAARDTVVEFMDFECPYCREFAMRLDTILERTQGTTLVVVQHFPLSIHRFAVPAAIVAECAQRQGAFWQVYRVLFTKQDSLGLKDWRSYAQEAGVPDLDAFEGCRKLPADSFPRIASGVDIGERGGVRSTPTVWINGESRRGTQAIGPLRQLLAAGKRVKSD